MSMAMPCAERRPYRVALAALALCTPLAAHAHRLDEYLEQTMIELEPARVVLRLDVTPGIAVAPQALSAIDADHDGVLSPFEQSSYAEQVRRDLALSIDGAPQAIRLVGAETRFPPIDAVRSGLGTIALTFETASDVVPQGTLRLVNHHASGNASYLANCIMPHDPSIRVLSQSRSRDQASYELKLRRSSSSATPWLIGLVGLSGLSLFWTARSSRRGLYSQ